MGILAWYPLTGDIFDISGNGYVVTGSPALDNYGKIGKTYDFSVRYLTMDYRGQGISLRYNNSISFWIKLKALPASGARYGVFETAYGAEWAVNVTDNGSLQLYYGTSGAETTPYTSTSSNFGLVANTWYHVAIVRNINNNTIEWYKNGNLIQQTALEYIPAESSTSLKIGRSYTGNLNGYLNDFRIYDHALTRKEVYEIAKAKILHYSFDDNEEPTENLIASIGNTINCTKSGNGVLIDWVANFADTYFYFTLANGATITPGLEYALSFKCTGLPLDKIVSFSWSNLDSIKITLQPGKNSLVFTAPSSPTTYFFDDKTRDASISSLFLYDFQLEKKGYSTDYVLGSRSGDILDYAGYSNHQAIDLAYSPKWISDSARGLGAYEFFTSSKINTPLAVTSDLFAQNSSSFTLMAWVKPLEAVYDASYAMLVGGTNNSGFGIMCYQSQEPFAYFRNINGTYQTISGTMLLNEWHHLAMRVDKGLMSMAFYVNGVRVGSPVSITNGSFSANSAISINEAQYAFASAGQTSPRHFAIDDVKIYMNAFTDAQILSEYQEKGSIDQDGNLFLCDTKEISIFDETIQNTNLVRNGCGEYGNNTNFPALQFDATENCFYRTSGSATWYSDDFILIRGNGLDKFDQYQLEAYFKQPSGTMARYYYMILCYDKDKRFIEYAHSYKRSGTDTFLTQALNPGDLYVYVNNLSGWFTDAFPTTYVHTKQFKLFPPDHEYPDYTYSRILGRYVDLDVANGRITLQSAWSGAVMPIGTSICNTNDGGGYSYIAASNALMTTDWVYRSAISSATEAAHSMRVGSRYVKVGALFNRDAGTVTGYIKNMKFFNVTDNGQSQCFVDAQQNLLETGVLANQQISEIGVSESLVGYYPLDGDYGDYSGNMNNAIATGTSFVGGISDLGCSFVNSTDKITISPITDKILTLSVWHKWDTTSTNWRTIFANSANIHHMIFNNSRSIGIWDGSFRTFGASGVSPDNEWHNYVMVIVNKKNAKLYIDGNYIGMTYTTIDLDTYPIMNIGGWGSYGCGYLDEVRIYNRILTPDEISINYDTYNPTGSRMKITKDCFYIKGQIKEGY